ncbi:MULTISPECIES: hypothetical protein [Rhizobium]|uniref:DUF3240 domain-containing protein n=1 Tax=Rhizobium wenxiniae TaxID=1737357 RepID=A0A7W9YE68_9HYPH|nr:hypothetical protein [Rhizobium wenxiniae]MBB6166128.1 hypothetical protein [Rhizobium wenxiniae]GGG21938.1 hypothetical protein GCM10010924_59280 [Rhizobium wenxiniae]
MPHLVEILLPLTKTLTREKLDTIRAELTDRFGGATLHSNAPAEGLWRDDGDLERDRIVIVEIMTDTLDRTWWAQFRERLENQLFEDEIVVRATEIERL